MNQFKINKRINDFYANNCAPVCQQVAKVAKLSMTKEANDFLIAVDDKRIVIGVSHAKRIRFLLRKNTKIGLTGFELKELGQLTLFASHTYRAHISSGADSVIDAEFELIITKKKNAAKTLRLMQAYTPNLLNEPNPAE